MPRKPSAETAIVKKNPKVFKFKVFDLDKKEPISHHTKYCFALQKRGRYCMENRKGFDTVKIVVLEQIEPKPKLEWVMRQKTLELIKPPKYGKTKNSNGQSLRTL